MKSKEELNALKNEVETVRKKLHELTDEELALVSGGRLELPTHTASPTLNPYSYLPSPPDAQLGVSERPTL